MSGSPRCSVIAPPAEFIAGERLSLLARRPLFEPLSSSLQALAVHDRVDVPALDAWTAILAPRPANAAGLPIRFVMPDAVDAHYEHCVYECGEVATRPGNWHDLFNALVWAVCPRTKAELNRLHVEEMAARSLGAPRGTLRDAATQFDESGMIVLATDPALLHLLRSRRWSELFWQRRSDVTRCMRFFVVGHGLYDALRAPFFGLCARAALVEVEAELLDAPLAIQVSRADAIMARRFGERRWYPRAKAFAPIPVLGIPGVCSQSECLAYYQDERQFRP